MITFIKFFLKSTKSVTITLCNCFSFLPNALLDGTDYGLSDGDMEASYATVKSMAEQIDADVILLREHQEAGGKVRDYLVRKRVGDNDFLEVR